jgi:hypothetical protein
MAEWLILLLLVPAIVVPVVMLVGFAGCSFDKGVAAGRPLMVSADATSDTAITLTWKYDEPAAGFLIERKQLSNGATGGELLGSPTMYIDTNLRAATTYEYTVTAIHLDESRSNPSLPERGTTRLANLSIDDDEWEGWCLVQRIEPARLSGLSSGTNITLTVRASSVSAASIDRVYISHPADGGDPYDSAEQIKVYDISDPSTPMPFPVPLGQARTLPAVDYDRFDKGKALLIAVDFSDPAVSLSQIGIAGPQPGAVAYFFLGSHAGETNRTSVARPVRGDGQYADTVCLIEKIEVK